MLRCKPWFWGAFVVLLWGLGGCGGEPTTCQNDRQCTGDRICLYGACADRSALAEKATEIAIEPQPEEMAAELPPEGGAEEVAPEPQIEIQPEVIKEAEPPGIRAEGEPCDPRPLAWPVDRCVDGFACAQIRDVTPSSGAPQPVGVCVKACSPQSSACPTGTRCEEVYNTRTRQPTGVFVCAKEVDHGEPCVNTQTCKAGLSCMRYDTSGAFWRCQKDCTNDNQCDNDKRCQPLTADATEKGCKTLRQHGESCSLEESCDEPNAACVPSFLVGVLGSCRKRCTNATECATGEICRSINSSAIVGSFCLKAAKRGERCLAGALCEETNDICATDDPNFPVFARCLKRCSGDNDCAADERCAQDAQRVSACRKIAGSGQLVDNLSACAVGSRAIAIESGQPAMCLPDCSSGTQTAPALCGRLSPGILFDVHWLDGQRVVAPGAIGEYLLSEDSGATWQRRRTTIAAYFRGIASAMAGKLLLMVGERGALLRSEDGGVRWSAVHLEDSLREDLYSVAIQEDGAHAIAVGAKGMILHSTDRGQSWQRITPTTPITTDLQRVAVGSDRQASPQPRWVIVGKSGVAIQSTDGAQSWSPIDLGGLTQDLFGVALVRDGAEAGKKGLIVGLSGTLWSTEDGSAWQADDSQTQDGLTAASLGGGKAHVVGANGTALRWEDDEWKKAAFPETRALYGVAHHLDRVVAVGAGGAAYLSTNQGETWTAFTTALAQCVGLRSGNQSAGGVCLLTCRRENNGLDCPPEIGDCSPLQLGNFPVNVCQQPARLFTPSGRAQEGQICHPTSRSADLLRCDEGLRCVDAEDASESRCLQPCDPSAPSCGQGKTCLTLGQAAYCATAVAKDQPCKASEGKLCGSGLICRRTPDGRNLCITDPFRPAQAYAPCENTLSRCPPQHICLGLPNTPYRSFCAPPCTPGASPSGCPAGWDCFSLTSGDGACLQRCTSENFQCTASHLSCKTVSSQGNQHCL